MQVPDWQRSYSWESAEVEAFWQDLVDFDDRYPGQNIENQEHFLGSIVLVTGGATNLLLDGQQRLATSTILLSALRDDRRPYKADAASRLQSKYVADFDDPSNATTYSLTLNVYDRNYFRTEVQCDPAPPVRPKPTLRSHSLIRAARQYFDARIGEKTRGLGGGEAAYKWNLRIEQVLCAHMSVAAVSSTDEDNAAAVFETPNDRGIGLSTPDLLRNLLLRRSEPNDDVTREQIVAAWQTVLGIHDEANVDDFLRHYWVSHRGDVKARKLYREIKDTIVRENSSSLVLSRDLEESALVYRDIVSAREDDAELRAGLEAIGELGARALYPAMLSGYAAVGSDGDKAPLRSLARDLVPTGQSPRYRLEGAIDSKTLTLISEGRY